jgi:hypothetical protein
MQNKNEMTILAGDLSRAALDVHLLDAGRSEVQDLRRLLSINQSFFPR